MSQDLSLRTVLRFWIPLAAAWLTMGVEGPILSALIARMAEPKENLAAFGVTFSLVLLCEAPILMLFSATIALGRNKESFDRFRRFALYLSGAMSFLLLLLAATPIFDFITLTVMNLDGRVRYLVRLALLIAVPAPFVVGFRRMFQGLLARSNKTRLVALGSVLRLLVMTGTGVTLFLIDLPHGVMVGWSALTLAVIAEAIASRVLASKPIADLPLSSEKETKLTTPAIIYFYYPLALTSIVNVAVHPLVSFSVARANFGLESLAVLPVVLGLGYIFKSGAIAFQEVAVNFIGQSKGNVAIVERGAILIGLFLSGIMALITFTPLSGPWFGTICGLSGDLFHFAQMPAQIFTLTPLLVTLISLERGVLVSAHRTLWITMSGVVELIVLAIVLILGIKHSDMPGATVAAWALTLGNVGGLATLILGRKFSPGTP